MVACYSNKSKTKFFTIVDQKSNCGLMQNLNFSYSQKPKSRFWQIFEVLNLWTLECLPLKIDHSKIFNPFKNDWSDILYHSSRIQYEQSLAKPVPQQILTYECPSYNTLGTEMVLNNTHYRRCFLVLFSKTVSLQKVVSIFK